MAVEPVQEPTKEPAPEPAPAEKPENPFETELRQSDLNFDELMKVKIIGKGNTLQDLKKRLDDQKNLILRLREGLWAQLLFHTQILRELTMSISQASKIC